MEINQQIEAAINLLESYNGFDYIINILKNHKISQWTTLQIPGSGYIIHGTVSQSVLSYNVGNTGNNQ